jgi:hypothetical protein
MKIIFLALVLSLISLVKNAIAECEFDFNKKIHEVYRDPRADVSIPFSFLEIPTFKELLPCSEKNKDKVIALMEASGVDDKEKSIAAFSLQVLQGDQYLFFAEQMTDLFVRKLVSEKVFGSALFPGLEWNSYLQHNYNLLRVERMLQRIKLETNYRSNFLDATISGKLKYAKAEPE